VSTTSTDESLHFKCVNSTTTSSPDESLPDRHNIAATNPFYSTTESSGDHLSTPKTAVMTGHIHRVSQGYTSELEGGLLRDACVIVNTTGLTSNFQPAQPVTGKNVSLSNTPFIHRPISSIGIANCDRITPDNPVSMPCHGKAPPIDPFTAEDITITFDDWLLIVERAASWNAWTSDETLMQLAGHLRSRASQE